MSHFLYDPDLYETVSTYTPCPCNGKCNGMCCGSASWGQRLRPPEEVARIKAEKRRKAEDDILAQADAIRIRRQAAGATEGGDA